MQENEEGYGEIAISIFGLALLSYGNYFTVLVFTIMRCANALACKDGCLGNENAMPEDLPNWGMEVGPVPQTSSVAIAVGTKGGLIAEGRSTIRGSYVLDGTVFVRIYGPIVSKAFCWPVSVGPPYLVAGFSESYLGRLSVGRVVRSNVRPLERLDFLT